MLPHLCHTRNELSFSGSVSSLSHTNRQQNPLACLPPACQHGSQTQMRIFIHLFNSIAHKRDKSCPFAYLNTKTSLPLHFSFFISLMHSCFFCASWQMYFPHRVLLCANLLCHIQTTKTRTVTKNRKKRDNRRKRRKSERGRTQGTSSGIQFYEGRAFSFLHHVFLSVSNLAALSFKES